MPISLSCSHKPERDQSYYHSILHSLHQTEKIMLQATVLVIQTWEAVKYSGIFMSNL